MDHIAVMVPDSRLVAGGFKTIETRFSKNRSLPFDRVEAGDTVYFKDFGGPVTTRCRVRRVEFYQDLEPDDIEGLRRLYGREICADEAFWKNISGRRYASVIFLNDAEPLTPYWPTRVPFNRNAWVVLDTPEKWDLWLGDLLKKRPSLFEERCQA